MAGRLQKKAKRGFRSYPIATIALYGPTATLATKIASVFSRQDAEPVLERWYSEAGDIRQDAAIENLILQFLREHDARSVAITDRIIGCPHEEGIDYPDGASCPQCPYWAGRDRWTGDRVQ